VQLDIISVIWAPSIMVIPLEYIRLIWVMLVCGLVEDVSSNQAISVPKAKRSGRGKTSK